MPFEIKLLTVRRSFEFAADDVRLAALSAPAVRAAIQEAFSFQGVAVTPIPPLFGPQAVDPSFPGLLFTAGIFAPDEGDPSVPVRTLTVELRRIVVEMVSAPEIIDSFFNRLCRVIADAPIRLSEPALGEPTHTIDYSELTIKLPLDPRLLLAPQVRDLMPRSLASVSLNGASIVPTIYLQAVSQTSEYGGLQSPTSVLSLRAGTDPGDGVFWSAAFLSDSAHRAFLTELGEALLHSSGPV